MGIASKAMVLDAPGADPSALEERGDRLSPMARQWLALLVATGSLALTGYLDAIAGSEFSVGLLYLVPVFIATWYARPIYGYIAAIGCALLRQYAEKKGAASFLLHPVIGYWNIYWNLSVRAIFFMIVVALISAVKNSRTRLETLVHQRTAMLRRLGVQLADAEEAERRNLAHDMHDGLSQSLLLLKMNLDALRSAISGSSPDQQARLADSVSIVDHVIKQTRTLMFDLHPAMLEDLGFAPTLSRYADEFKHRTGVDVAISESGTSFPLGRSLGHHLFRAVKELLSNAARHGKAKEILVSLHWESARLRVVVDDDGCGFDVAGRMESAARKSLGLVGIQERLGSLNGEFQIESVVGQGTRAVIEVPAGESQELS